MLIKSVITSEKIKHYSDIPMTESEGVLGTVIFGTIWFRITRSLVWL